MMKTYEGAYAEATQAATQLFEAARDLQSIHYLCNSLALQGHLARICGDYDAARVLYAERALPLAERSGVPDREPFLRLKLSALARLTGDYEAASRQLEEGVMIGDRLHVNQASILSEQGRLAYAQHDYRAAAEYLRKATVGGLMALPLDSFESPLSDLGDVLCAMGNAEAEGIFQHSLQESRQARSLPRVLQALGGLARFYAKNDDSGRALELALLVQRHPATWHEHRVRAEELAQHLVEELPADTVAAARERAQERDPWAVADEILAVAS